MAKNSSVKALKNPSELDIPNSPGQNSNSVGVVDKLVLRLPDGLRDKVKKLSEFNRRSMNSEIIMVLEKHVSDSLVLEIANQDNLLNRQTMAVLAEDQANERLEALKRSLLDLISK